MKPPCEIVVKYVLPTLRAMIAQEMSEKYGLKQKESARKLGITQSAVSYYLSGGRANRVVQDYGVASLREKPQIKEAVRRIAKAIAHDEATTIQVVQELCKTCVALRTADGICKAHVGMLPSIGDNCNMCQLLFKATTLSSGESALESYCI